MSDEPEWPSQDSEEADEQVVCMACTFPNDSSAHFCAKCGAPLSSYASTGPLEHIFAEGYAYRQAAERPRSFIVVLGVWLIFGMLGSLGIVGMVISRKYSFPHFLMGVLCLTFSLVMIFKTTRNYFAGKKVEEKRDA